jgi:hypothetical protein
MATSNDNLEKTATGVAASASSLDLNITSSAAKAIKALCRDSAAASAAAQSLSISKDIKEMQRRLKAVEPAPNLSAAMRDLESPVMKAARELALSQSHLSEAARAAAATETSVVEAARQLARSQNYISDAARSALQL